MAISTQRREIALSRRYDVYHAAGCLTQALIQSRMTGGALPTPTTPQSRGLSCQRRTKHAPLLGRLICRKGSCQTVP